MSMQYFINKNTIKCMLSRKDLVNSIHVDQLQNEKEKIELVNNDQ